MHLGALRDLVAQKYSLEKETIKLIGLTAGRLPDPSTPLAQLPKLKPSAKASGTTPKPPTIMVLGTRSEVVSEIAQLDSVAEALDAAELAARAEREAREQAYRERQMEIAIRQRQELEANRIRSLQERQRQLREQMFEAERRRRQADRDSAPILEYYFTPAVSEQADKTGMAFLPESVLATAMDKNVPMPLAFECTLWTEEDEQYEKAKRQAEEEAVRRYVERRYPQLFREIQDESELSVAVPHFGLDEDAQVAQEDQMNAITPPQRRKAYCSVAQFTSESNNVATFPRQLLQSIGYDLEWLTLGIAEIPKVHIRTISLQKGTSITLQPLTPQWNFIHETERNSLLEYYLRKYILVAEHSIISLEHNGRVLQFFVNETKPSHVISLVDTELTTEILPYSESFVAPRTAEEIQAFEEREREKKTNATEDQMTAMISPTHIVYRPTTAMAPGFPTAARSTQDASSVSYSFETEDSAMPPAPLQLARSHSDHLPVATVVNLQKEPGSDVPAARVEISFTTPGEAAYIAIPITDSNARIPISLRLSPPKASPTSAFAGSAGSSPAAAAVQGAAATPTGGTSTFDVDLYCSFFERHPGPDAYELCCQTIGNKELVIDHSASPDFVVGGFAFVSFLNYGGACDCVAKLAMTATSGTSGATKTGQQLISQPQLKGEGKESKDRDDDEPEDSERCETCQQWVPTISMRLHAATCRRRFQACPSCQKVFPKTGPEFQKHFDQIHQATYTCRCGNFKGTQLEVHSHRSTEYVIRLH